VDIGLEFSSPEIKQGSIVSAQIKVDASSAQEFPLQKIKSKTFAETIYIYDVGIPLRKEGRPYFEADAKIIFVKVPESNQLSFTEDGQSFKVFWNEIKIIPTEVEKTFLYGVFSVPSRFQYITWILSALGILVLVTVGIWFYRKHIFKVAEKKKLSDLKNKLLKPVTYEEVVQVWMERQIFLTTFPKTEEAFRQFEQTLFKVQFKPKQSESEKEKVLDSYKQFLSSIKGLTDGI
jgi:hypothetical protein